MSDDRPASQYKDNPRMRGRSVPSPAPRIPMAPREERLIKRPLSAISTENPFASDETVIEKEEKVEDVRTSD